MTTNGVPPSDALPRRAVLALAVSLLVVGAVAFAAGAIDRNGSKGPPPITSHGEWRTLSPQSSWSVWQPACIVRSTWTLESPSGDSATATLSVSTVAGSDIYIVGIFSEVWAEVSDGEELSVDFGFDDEPPERDTIPASVPVVDRTSAGDAGSGFFTGVDAAFLGRMAGSRTMEVYRNGSETISLDTSGAVEAIGILLACETMERARIGLPVENPYSVERPPQGPRAENAER